jgi:tetratricopeptide (TPR) repeat protein
MTSWRFRPTLLSRVVLCIVQVLSTGCAAPGKTTESTVSNHLQADPASLVDAAEADARGTRYAAAQEKAGRALTLVAERGDEILKARAHMVLGLASAYLSNLPAAHQNLAIALQIRQRVLGDDARDTARAYEALGVLYLRTGAPSLAKPLFEKGLQSHLKRGDPDTAEAHVNLAMAMEDLDDFPGAIAHNQSAISILTQDFSGPQDLLARCYGNLGIVYARMDNPKEAMAMFERALNMEIALGEKESELKTRANIANLHFARGKYKEALQAYETVVQGLEELPAAFQLDVATACYSAGLARLRLKQYRGALDMFKKAASLRREYLGPEHRVTLEAEEQIDEVCKAGFKVACR